MSEPTKPANTGEPDPPPDEFGPWLDENRPAVHPVLRLVYLVVGVICIALGVVGWLVPIVTGIPFYILGAWLLGLASVRVRHAINALERKLPAGLRRRLRRPEKGA